MAEETVEIIRIQFDATEAIKATKELKDERDKLIKLGKELEKTEGKNSEAAIKNAAQVKVLSDQIREQEKVSQNLIKANTELAGSNQQLKAQLSLATSQLNRMSEEEKTTTERGKALTAQVLELTNKLKANESAVGNNFRNVGNYREALFGLGGGLGKAAQGISGFNQTLKANPVLAVVAAIQFFGSALSKLQPVLDGINVALGALNGVFDVLIERTKLLLQGDLIGAFTGVGDAVSEAAAAGAEYARVQKDIADAQQIQNIQNAQAEKQIAVLTVQLKDKTKTDEERLAIADQISQIEKENFAVQQQILQQTLAGEEKKVRALLKTKGVQVGLLNTTQDLIKAAQEYAVQDEAFKKLEESQIALTNAEKESLQITERAQVRRNAILDQANEARQKEIEREKERLKKLEEERKKYNENLAKLQEEFNLTEREKVQKGFDDKLKTLTKGGDAEIKLRAQIEAKKAEALTKFDADLFEKERDLQARRDLAILAIQQDSLETRLKVFEINFQKEAAELAKQGNTSAEIEQIKQAKITKIRQDEQIKSINEQVALNDTLLQNELAAVDNSVATEQEKATRKAQINLKYLELQLKNVEALANADGQITAQELANIEKVKQAIIGAQNAVTQSQIEKPPQSLGELFGATPEEAAKIDDAISFTLDSLNQVVGIINERYQREIDGINQVRDAQIAEVENSTLNEEEKKTKIAQINQKAAREAYALQVKQFNAEKALNLTTAIINGAQAVLKAAGQLGPIGAAIGAAISIAQIALIAAQKPPPPPKFATGVVGLDGPGNETSDSIPAYLSKGESVITARGTKFAQANYPGLLEFLNTRNKFADGVVNFSNSPTPSAIPNVGEQVRAALQDLTIVTKVTDIEKAAASRNEVRTVGVI